MTPSAMNNNPSVLSKPVLDAFKSAWANRPDPSLENECKWYLKAKKALLKDFNSNADLIKFWRASAAKDYTTLEQLEEMRDLTNQLTIKAQHLAEKYEITAAFSPEQGRVIITPPHGSPLASFPNHCMMAAIRKSLHSRSEERRSASKELRLALFTLARIACAGLRIEARTLAELAWINDWLKHHSHSQLQMDPKTAKTRLFYE